MQLEKGWNSMMRRIGIKRENVVFSLWVALATTKKVLWNAPETLSIGPNLSDSIADKIISLHFDDFHYFMKIIAP